MPEFNEVPPKFPNVPDFIVLYKCTPAHLSSPLYPFWVVSYAVTGLYLISAPLSYPLCTDFIVSCKWPPNLSTVHWLHCVWRQWHVSAWEWRACPLSWWLTMKCWTINKTAGLHCEIYHIHSKGYILNKKTSLGKLNHRGLIF